MTKPREEERNQKQDCNNKKNKRITLNNTGSLNKTPKKTNKTIKGIANHTSETSGMGSINRMVSCAIDSV